MSAAPVLGYNLLHVASPVRSAALALAPLGLLLAGPLSDLHGVRVWFYVARGVCAMMGTAGFFILALMNLEDAPASPAAAGAPSPQGG